MHALLPWSTSSHSPYATPCVVLSLQGWGGAHPRGGGGGRPLGFGRQLPPQLTVGRRPLGGGGGGGLEGGVLGGAPGKAGPRGRGGASIGQVWTRHLAPAAPASRPSSPSQFHDCPCHADSALQFVPSLVPGWGKSRAASTGFRALSPSD